MGSNARQLVQDNFTWTKIAEQTNELYDWLLDECDTPNFVYLN